MATKPYEIFLERVKNMKQIGPLNKAYLEDFLNYDHPGCVLMSKWSQPPIIEKGKGNRVWDVDGKEYIDCISGFSSMNIGHGDKRISKVMAEQYEKLSHWFDFPTPERIRLIKRLADITPGDFNKKVRLALSGSDAVELAIRSARSYTKKTHIICFYGADKPGKIELTLGFAEFFRQPIKAVRFIFQKRKRCLFVSV